MPGRTPPVLTLLLAAALCAAALAPSRAVVSVTAEAKEAGDARQLPFAPGEELFYQADFSRSLLRGIEIAEFHFVTEREPATAAAEPAPAGFVFKGDVRAKGWFRKIFGLDFHYRQESFVDGRTLRIRRTTKLDEQGRRVRESEAVFDALADRVTWTEREPNNAAREPRVVTGPLAGADYDIISAIYCLRTRPLAVGQSFDLGVSDSGQTYRVPVKVVKRETMKTAIGRVSALRVEVGLFGERGLVSDRKGEMTIWITEDARRLPVRARLDAEVGTLDIKLKKASGLAASAPARK
jgi:hypothetical protein